MRFMKSGALLLAVVGTAASAAGQVSPVPIQGPIRHVQYGEGGSAKSAPRIIYSNTSGAMYYSTPGIGSEFIDWGVVSSNADHDTVTSVTLGYATNAPSASLRFRVYSGYTGFCGVIGSTDLDVTLTGLPGSPSPGVAQGWTVSLNLSTAGDCFHLENGPFGYGYTGTDNTTGPLYATGGAGNVDFIDVVDHLVGCYVFCCWGGPFLAFYAEFVGHDGNVTFPGGCGGGLALEIAGPTCTGSTVTIEVSGASVGDWWAIALGTSIGAGIGGTLGGCPIDVVPVVPIRVMGQLPAQPLTFPATVSFAAGLVVGLQVITKDPTSGAFDSSNTEILHVP